jgi:hypothetical protein
MGVLEMSTIAKLGGELVGIVIGELGECTLPITEWPLRNRTDFLEAMLLTLPGVGETGAPWDINSSSELCCWAS